MKKLLWINSCVNQETSRTRRLTEALLTKLKGEAAYEIEELILEQENIAVLDSAGLARRIEKVTAGDFSDPEFRYAKQLQNADAVVISAPYWDLGFPAMLKIYFEAVTIVGLTFCYDETGAPKGLCKGEKLWYVTTAGGYLPADVDFGFDYAAALCKMYGINRAQRIAAQGLDIIGADVEAILQKAEAEIKVK